MGIGFNIIGRKVGEEIKKFIQVVFEARKDDNRNALLYTPAGDDSIPLDDERLILLKVDGQGKYIAAGVLTPSQGAKPGEKIFFARDLDGAVVSKLSMLHEGHVDYTQDGNFTGNIEKNAELTVVGNASIAVGGDKDEGVEGSRTESVGGNQEENVAGSAKYTSADTDIISKAPVGINDGLYKTGLSPYLTSETSALQMLSQAASLADEPLSVLDALSGGTGFIIGLGAAIAAYCTAMQSADAAAHTSISKAVK
jgi:hypothetical protein